MTFSRYACWNIEALNNTTVLDAAALPGWIFSGVHHPLPAHRRRLGAKGLGELVTEIDARSAIEGEARPEGYLLVPVVGSAGSGKTHLVKWVYEQVQSKHDNWRLLYLPKNGTSLREVIARLIDGQSGKAIEKAREALEKAPAQGATDPALATLLIDRLAYLAEHGEPQLGNLTKKQAELRTRVRRELPVVLNDPVTREAMTRRGGVIPRLVDLAKKGRSEGDEHDDYNVRISTDDLPLVDVELGATAKPTQKILTQWRVGADKAEAAVAVVNELLPECIKYVFLTEGIDLIEILKELRIDLQEQEMELALFIEDLTVLHGVERAFLDAVVQVAQDPEGGPTMCPLRVLFAITEGHLDSMATMRERCEDAFHMDTTHGEGGLEDHEAVTFLARYLNGSRLDHGTKKLTNACKSCEHRESCHDAFGFSGEDHGLYPFTAQAATNFARAHSREDGRFDPRRTVRGLRDHLIKALGEIPGGDYPSATLLEQFADSAPLVDGDVLRSLRESGHTEKSTGVVRFWTSSPPQVTEDDLVDLPIPLEVLTAFGLPTTGLQGGRTDAPHKKEGNGKGKGKGKGKGEEEEETPTPPPPWSDKLEAKFKELLDLLPAWSQDGKLLNNTQAKNVRQLVRDAVKANIEVGNTPHFHDHWFPSGDRDHLRDALIHVKGSAGNPPPDPVLTVEADDETAYALRGLLRTTVPLDDDIETFRLRIAAAELVAKWTDQLAAHFEAAGHTEELAEATAGLCLASLASGRLQPPFGPEDLIAKLLSPLDPPEEGTARSKKWDTAMNRLVGPEMKKHTRRRDLVRQRLGESRGKGDVRAIDASRLQVLVDDFLDALENDRPTSIDAELTRFKDATDTEWQHLEKCTERISDVDTATPWRDEAKAVLKTLNDAWVEGLYTQREDRERLIELELGAGDDDHHSLARLAEVHQDGGFVARFCFAASPDALLARKIAEFCLLSTKGFAEIDKKLAAGGGGAGDSDAVLQELLNKLQALQDLLESTNKNGDS